MGDESGRLSRFEYDNLYRLTGIYNHDDHLIKTNEYQYNTISFSKNTIVEREVLQSGQTTVAGVTALTGSNVIRTFNYFDGLGRASQSVKLDFSPTSKDWYKHVAYDDFGREVKDFLPYTGANAATTYDQVFRSNAPTEQVAFWNTFNSGDGTYAYTEKILEPSPLERQTGTKHPGQNFNSYPSETFYFANANEVRNPKTANSYYPANTLFKTINEDEDNKTVISYTDKLGRLIMQDMGGSKTYYIYNTAGKVVQIIQPEGAVLLHSTPTNLHSTASVLRHSFVYTYDVEYRLSTKRVPGTDNPYVYTYDRLDRVILEQDPNGFKTYTKYDIQGRIIQTGKYTGTSSPTGSETLYESPNTTSGDHFYTKTQSFPTSLTEPYIINYYDDFDFNNDASHVDDMAYQTLPTVGSTNYPSTFSTNHPATANHLFVRGKMTQTKTGILNSNGSAPSLFSKTSTFFDKFGRALHIRTEHTYNNTDFEWISYHFAGWELNRSREHKATISGISSTLFTTDRMTYDHAGRMYTKYHRINNGTENLVTTHTYTESDQLKTKTMGTGIQTIDYKYNIRGWLTDINDVDVCNTDLFRMKLKYEIANSNISATAHRNGNISSMEWRTGSSCVVNGTSRNKSLYGFTYDGLNRMTSSKYGEITGTTNVNRYNENLTYNLNGDILKLGRYGKSGTSSFGQIDTLTYNYPSTGAQRLTSVSDASIMSFGFTTTGGTSQSYSYDANGNLTGRTNTPYNTITYNHLNLPHTISGTGGTITNVYDAAGRKWQSTVSGVTTTYFGDVEYEGTGIKMIYHEAGERACSSHTKWLVGEVKRNVRPAVKRGAAMKSKHFERQPKCFCGKIERITGTTYEYQYYIKDHLGNVRVVFKSGPTLISEHHYYPFGLNQEGSFYTSGTTQKYKYNGKELVGSLGWYDYGARWYDACVGRFTGVDPLASDMPAHSPFCYGFNNPVRFTDPTGMSPDDFVKDASGNIRWDNNANSQATTKAGETYLGKTLTFNFNSYIDKNLWDGPMGDKPAGDKLTSTVTVTGNENSNGELTSLSATKSIKVGPTPVGTARDYYPGEGGSNNSLSATTTSTGVNIGFEQHASVSPIEQLGMNAMGFKIVDVAQKLNIDYNKSNGNLSISAYTGVFPSASLSVNGSSIMQYNQPSFVKTHSARTGTTPISSSGTGGNPIFNFSYYPSQFFKR